MAIYEVETENGVFAVETEDLASPRTSTSLTKKVWGALKVPEQFVKRGSEELVKQAKSIPDFGYTGNSVRDIALNTPKAINESIAETIDKVVPGLVSRGSIVTAGALKGAQMSAPAIKAVGKTVAKGAEKLSGLHYDTPGVLREAFNDPSLIFGKGIENARKLYEGAKASGGKIGPDLEATLDKMDFVKKTLDYVKGGGMVNPSEALEARKILDSLKNKIAGPAYHAARKIFDDIAKTAYSEADKGFQRGIKAEALRDFMPKNKTGTPSIAKMAAGFGATGATLNPFVAALAATMSPAVQGATASSLGAASKLAMPFIKSPQMGAATASILQQIFGSR